VVGVIPKELLGFSVDFLGKKEETASLISAQETENVCCSYQ
jgi:hypothetical protein